MKQPENKSNIARKRHILKSITWRIIASITSFLLTWSITGNIDIGLSVGVADVVIKFILYYLHERVWYKSNYGVKKRK